MKTLISILTFACICYSATAQTYVLQKTVATPDDPLSFYNHRAALNEVKWLNNDVLVTGDVRGTLVWWNVSTGRQTHRVRLGPSNILPPITVLEKPPGGVDFFVVGQPGRLYGKSHPQVIPIRLFRNDGTQLDIVEDSRGRVQPVAFRKSKRTGNRLIMMSGGDRAWRHDISNPHAINSQRFANWGGHTLVTSGDDNFLARAYNAGPTNYLELLEWGGERRIIRRSPTSTGVKVLVFNPNDSGELIGGKADGTVQWWDNGSAVHTQGGTKTGPINDIVFHRNGRLFMTAHDGGGIQVWDAEDRIPLGSVHQPDGSVRAIDMAPNGRMASVGTDGKVYVWRYINGDVNGDGNVNRRDIAVIANNYGNKRDADGKLPRGDVNTDGIVNRKDLMLVAEIVEGIEGIPAAPMLRRLGLQTWGELKRR